MSKERRYLKGSLDEYLKELSAKTIVPGGGSAAALTAALGAGLNLMVINYSLKKASVSSPPRGLAAAKARQQESLDKLSSLIDEDCRVFRSLMKALSSGKDAQKEYEAAAAVPMNICRECHVSMDITRHLLKKGNRNLITDIGSAADILKAAFNSAQLNVEINLNRIKNRKFAEDARKTLSSMKRGINNQFREVNRRVKETMRKKEERWAS